MHYLSLLSKEMIAVLVVGLIAVLVVVIFISSFNKKKRIIRKTKDLDRKYSYLHNLLITTDSAYIHRLEIISRTNLLFVEKFNGFAERYRNLLDVNDKECGILLSQVKVLVKEKSFKEVLGPLSELKNKMMVFEKGANQLDSELYALIKPEEDSRQTILNFKEQYRNLKERFESRSDEIEIIVPTIEKVYLKLDSLFTEFDSCLENGQIDEANALIPTFKQAIESLEFVFQNAPKICILVTKIVPSSIKEIADLYDNLSNQKVPLFNLGITTKLEDWNARLKVCTNNLIALRLRGIKENLEKIQDEIMEIRGKIDAELGDKEVFLSKNDTTGFNVNVLEHKFIKIGSSMGTLRSYYKIDEEHESQLAELKNVISKVGDTKRALDNLTLSSTPQPYSILRSKLDELRLNYETAQEGLNNFKLFLDSLKVITEEANTLVKVYYYRCKQIESTLRVTAIPELTEEYMPIINQIYECLNNVADILSDKPIDAEYLSEIVANLKGIAINCFENFEESVKNQQLAEAAIVYGNRDRNHRNDVATRLDSLEKSFFECDFKRVYKEAKETYDHLHAEVKSND